MIQPHEELHAAGQWNDLQISLEGGAEFSPFWYFGAQKKIPMDEPFYHLHPQAILRYEPTIFKYAILACVQSFFRKFYNEDAYHILKAIQYRAHTATEIAEELGDTSPKSVSAIEIFLDSLVEENLILKGKYLISLESPPEQCISPSFKSSVPYPSAPFYTMIYLTYHCNLKCKHCGLSSTLTRDILPGIEWKKIFYQLERAGIWTVTLNGGEPLSHPDIISILEYLSHSSFWVRLFTNGTLLTDEEITIISRGRNFYLSISLDGANSATHDAFRGKAGTYKRVIDTFERLEKTSSHLMNMIACVIHKKNLSQFEDIMEIALQHGLQGVSFISMNYLGRAQTEGYYISVQEHPEILTSLMDLARKYEDRLFITVQGRGPTLKVADRPFPQYFGHDLVCNAGIMDWIIDPVGDVYPCEIIVALDKESREQFCLGNIVTQSLPEIWNSSGYHLFRGGYKESDLEVCTQCAFYERCGQKKCRLYALATTGNFHGASYECQFSQSDLGILPPKKVMK